MQGDTETGEPKYAVTMRPLNESPAPGGPGDEDKEQDTQVNPLSDLCDNERNMGQPIEDVVVDRDDNGNLSDEEFAKIEAKII